MTSASPILTTALGLGTAPISSTEDGPLWWGPQDRDEAIAAVRAAVDVGAGWVDTAPMYGWGRAEELVGEALDGRAERPLVLTKCACVPGGANGRGREDASPATIRRDVQQSLRRLRTDRLDVVQIHDPDPQVPIEESWGALMDLVAEGLIAAAGLSNHPVELMDRALAIGPVAVVQHQYSLLHREPERDGVLDWCARHGVPFLAWSPLASGFLTDAFDLSTLHPTDLRHGLRWASARREWTDDVRARAGRVASRHGTSMVVVALAWVTRAPGTHAIVGARTPAEAAVLGQRLPVLTEQDVAELSAAAAP